MSFWKLRSRLVNVESEVLDAVELQSVAEDVLCDSEAASCCIRLCKSLAGLRLLPLTATVVALLAPSVLEAPDWAGSPALCACSAANRLSMNDCRACCVSESDAVFEVFEPEVPEVADDESDEVVLPSVDTPTCERASMIALTSPPPVGGADGEQPTAPELVPVASAAVERFALPDVPSWATHALRSEMLPIVMPISANLKVECAAGKFS